MTTRQKSLFSVTFSLLLMGALPGQAQETGSTQQPAPGWRKFGEPRGPELAPAGPDQSQNGPYQQQAGPGPYQGPPGPDFAPPPPQLVIAAGTWIKVRVDQPISSDHSQQGQAFTATLDQPLVVNGFVVARRGQTIEGRIAEVDRGGKVKGTSRLGLELTEMSLVDGQQVPLRTQLIEYVGGPSVGRDATAIATTTGVGAAIGAAADGGFGAGMGAIAGAAASTIGVLVTRGRATVVDPESVLTFRTLAPITISTERSAQAFQPVQQQDFAHRQLQQRRVMPAPAYPYYAGYPYYYSPWYSPYYFGPSFYFYSGPRFYGGRGYYYGGRGYYRRR
jgi:hypothetical protein